MAERDVYDVAYVADGHDRVVDTAVVALVRSGRVRVHAPGQLATVDPTRRHPVEAAVLDAMGTTGHRSMDTIRWRLSGDDRLDDLGRKLHKAGLLGRTAAVGALVHGQHRALAPTRAGRRLLAAAALAPAPDPEVVRVALGGPGAMEDVRLRASIFEPPPLPEVGGREIRRLQGQVQDGDPSRAAYLAGGAELGGGFIAGIGGDGGGF
jgi:hypothetical protein